MDCSHGNSLKDHTIQPLVLENCINQIIDGNQSIVGVMLESNLKPGNQKVGNDLSNIEYGVSITDACIGWDETAILLQNAYEKCEALQKR